jgi:orotate phosphoribosyltransferase
MSGELERLAGGRRGHFAFPSGFHGDLWLELDLLFADPAAGFAARLAERLPACDVVCGPMVGGALLAQLVAARLGVAFVWSEMPGYELPVALRPLVRGRRVVVVDDAVNAGSAVSATIASLGAAEVVGVGALMVLGGGYDPGVPFVGLERLESSLWPADDCPLCAAGVPFDEATAAG